MKPGVESRTKALNRKLFHHANEYERTKREAIEWDKHTRKYISTRACWKEEGRRAVVVVDGCSSEACHGKGKGSKEKKADGVAASHNAGPKRETRSKP